MELGAEEDDRTKPGQRYMTKRSMGRLDRLIQIAVEEAVARKKTGAFNDPKYWPALEKRLEAELT